VGRARRQQPLSPRVLEGSRAAAAAACKQQARTAHAQRPPPPPPKQKTAHPSAAAAPPRAGTLACLVHTASPASRLLCMTYRPQGYSCPSSCGVTNSDLVVNMPRRATTLSGWASSTGPAAGCGRARAAWVVGSPDRGGSRRGVRMRPTRHPPITLGVRAGGHGGPPMAGARRGGARVVGGASSRRPSCWTPAPQPRPLPHLLPGTGGRPQAAHCRGGCARGS
jgi:hypothetical protein